MIYYRSCSSWAVGILTTRNSVINLWKKFFGFYYSRKAHIFSILAPSLCFQIIDSELSVCKVSTQIFCWNELVCPLCILRDMLHAAGAGPCAELLRPIGRAVCLGAEVLTERFGNSDSWVSHNEVHAYTVIKALRRWWTSGKQKLKLCYLGDGALKLDMESSAFRLWVRRIKDACTTFSSFIIINAYSFLSYLSVVLQQGIW